MNKELAKDFFSCKNIGIDLGGREILRNINIDIKPGEVLGIIGPNGAGKTSLIEILSGRYKQKTGDVIYKDQIINNKPLYERARMGIGRTYQTPVVPEELTVGETLKAARQSTKPYLPVTDAEYAADLVKFKVNWDTANTKLETFFETPNSSSTLSIVNGRVAALELVEKARSCAGEIALKNLMNLTFANRLIKNG